MTGTFRQIEQLQRVYRLPDGTVAAKTGWIPFLKEDGTKSAIVYVPCGHRLGLSSNHVVRDDGEVRPHDGFPGFVECSVCGTYFRVRLIGWTP